MNKHISLVFIGIFLALLLTACAASDAAPTAVPTTDATVASSSGSSAPTTVANLGAYPGPTDLNGGDVNGYPAPNQGGASSAAVLPAAPAEAPLPASGQASISGLMYSQDASRFLSGLAIYLIRLEDADPRKFPDLLGDPEKRPGSVGGQTDAQGKFALTNIPPGSYYLVVWAPYTWRPIEVSKADTQPQLLVLAADQRLVLGVVFVSWP